MSDIPPAVRNRLLASARRLLMAAQRPDSTERCHACGSRPRGVLDGAPEYRDIDGTDDEEEDKLVECLAPAACPGCGTHSAVFVLGSFMRWVGMQRPSVEREGEDWQPDPADLYLIRAWLPGREFL